MTALSKAVRWAVVAAGVVLLGWGLWPSPRRTYTADVGEMRLAFSVPTVVHVGDAPRAQLSILPLATPAAGRASGSAQHLQRLVARLTFNGVNVTSAGEVSLTVRRSAPARFTWRLHALAAGSYLGSLWVYQVFPDGSRMARLTYPLHLRVGAFLGLSAPQARLLGLFALLMGGLLVLVL